MSPADPRAPIPVARPKPRANGPLRTLVAMAAVLLAFAAVAGQLVKLALSGQISMSSTMSQAVGQSFARPDIVDRQGRLLATDVEAYSLFADPALVIDRDEVVEKLGAVFPDLDRGELRNDLRDRKRRFVWVRRGLSPKTAQRVHNLGLPGLDFRRELRRAYPGGALAGHVLGYVNIDNKGVSGIERYLDESVGVESVQAATLADRAPVRLSLDIGVQHAVEAELADAVRLYQAKGAAGIVLDVRSGEVLASASYPQVDPAHPTMSLDPVRADKLAGSTFELGSIFKAFTVAMALDGGYVTTGTLIDASEPLKAGRFTIKDLHAVGRPMTVADVFIHSSNIGAAKLGLLAGPEHTRSFLKRLNLLGDMKTEAGTVAPPQVPQKWGDVETMTVAYGHGLAVAPLQFAAAAGALVNGGYQVRPTYIKRAADAGNAKVELIDAATSAMVRDFMRRNVTDAEGTGKRAEVPGYKVGGKTGTAEIPGPGGYREKAVIASFLASFPMDRPEYVVLVLLFEPKPTAASSHKVLAGLNAAPTTGRIIERIGPLLDVTSADAGAVRDGTAFDVTSSTK